MTKNTVDDATVERLRYEIASARLRLAERMATEPDLPDTGPDATTRVGRLHRVFTLMGDC